ncbi:hypothetical protein SeMB42_g05829 [Synchytrium endobioticum]|uniref:Zinc finger protein 830 n=1 Tax=Synchytrium endobioticum TaxID=286115 RepID=A0A507CP25_9FUNG|nr:hypothetical protein SeMB42_g05829 [Synchytrium endobioticum]TPX43998.1 hypothetical protein SeLEV6574_g04772 [Synchytrium endobioticum]
MADARQLLKQAKLAKQADHPLLSADASGRTTCIICKTVVKTALAHFNSHLHKANVEAIKSLKSGGSSINRAPAAGLPMSTGVKRSASASASAPPEPDDGADLKKARVAVGAGSAAQEPVLVSGLPANFFDSGCSPSTKRPSTGSTSSSKPPSKTPAAPRSAPVSVDLDKELEAFKAEIASVGLTEQPPDDNSQDEDEDTRMLPDEAFEEEELMRRVKALQEKKRLAGSGGLTRRHSASSESTRNAPPGSDTAEDEVDEFAWRRR